MVISEFFVKNWVGISVPSKIWCTGFENGGFRVLGAHKSKYCREASAPGRASGIQWKSRKYWNFGVWVLDPWCGGSGSLEKHAGYVPAQKLEGFVYFRCEIHFRSRKIEHFSNFLGPRRPVGALGIHWKSWKFWIFGYWVLDTCRGGSGSLQKHSGYVPGQKLEGFVYFGCEIYFRSRKIEQLSNFGGPRRLVHWLLEIFEFWGTEFWIRAVAVPDRFQSMRDMFLGKS